MLKEHLESGRPDAWRSAHKILEHYWGRPTEHVSLSLPVDSDGVGDLSTLDDLGLQALKRQLLADQRRETPGAGTA